MHAGFMFLERGSIRGKNRRNVMMKTFLGLCIAAIMFYVIGYGLAFGSFKKFGGKTMFAGDDIDANRNWCF